MSGGSDCGPIEGEAVSKHDPREDYDDVFDMGPLAPAHIVQWPASMMWVFGLLQLIITQMGMAVFASSILFTIIDEHRTLGEVWNSTKEQEAILLALPAWPIATVCTIVVMRAANDLKRFRRYPSVFAGAILTFLSLPFFYLGVVQVPLGIWLMVLLLRRDVQARFEAVARGKVSGAASAAR